jgi:hypothetical protein
VNAPGYFELDGVNRPSSSSSSSEGGSDSSSLGKDNAEEMLLRAPRPKRRFTEEVVDLSPVPKRARRDWCWW